MSAPNPLISPALSSTSNTSSFIMLSNTLTSSTALSDDSDDEIIYTVSSDSFLSADESLSDSASEDDFVVLSRPRSQLSFSETGLSTPDTRAVTPDIAGLATGLANLTIANAGAAPRKGKAGKLTTLVIAGAVVKKKKKKKFNKPKTSPVKAPAYSSPARPDRAIALVVAKQSGTSPKPKKSKKAEAIGIGGRSIVDDASDKFSDYGEKDINSHSVYEEAFGFITSFLSNPAARNDSACRLTLLQALIIELGLARSSLPSSLTAAKAYLKSHAFLNIREYMAVRDQGPAAVQRIMHPSRSALIKDIRKNKNKASLGWVKNSGLNVLLVQCYH